MIRLIVQLGAWSVFGLLAGIALTRHFAFRNPPLNPLPLPRNLISVGAPAGTAYLAEIGIAADHSALNRAFTPQIRRSYSGVASAVIVLNALLAPDTPMTQPSFFTDAVRRIRGPVRVSCDGMSLENLRNVLDAHGVDSEMQYASELDVDTFRTIASRNLETSGDFLIVNYSRASLTQEGGANFAPAAAYHAASDRILLLDPAVANYPPVWVTVPEIFNAMKISDADAPRGRGFVTVRETRR
jgi:hypothetical protein